MLFKKQNTFFKEAKGMLTFDFLINCKIKGLN